MHKTETVDFALCVSGRIYLVLTFEVLMKPGDTCVQRGTNHAWSTAQPRLSHDVRTGGRYVRVKSSAIKPRHRITPEFFANTLLAMAGKGDRFFSR